MKEGCPIMWRMNAAGLSVASFLRMYISGSIFCKALASRAESM